MGQRKKALLELEDCRGSCLSNGRTIKKTIRDAEE